MQHGRARLRSLSASPPPRRTSASAIPASVSTTGPSPMGTISRWRMSAIWSRTNSRDRPDVHVIWTFFRGAGPALNESLAAGQLDFAAGLGDLPSIVGRSRGLKTEFLASAGSHDPLYLAVPANSKLSSIEDLRGYRVAQFRGTNLQIATDRVLEAHRLTERDIQFVSLDSNAATAALVSGNVDASFGNSAYLDLAKRGVVKVIYSTKGDSPVLGRNSRLYVTDAFENARIRTTPVAWCAPSFAPLALPRTR